MHTSVFSISVSTYAIHVRHAKGKAEIVFVIYDLAWNYYARHAIKCRKHGCAFDCSKRLL